MNKIIIFIALFLFTFAIYSQTIIPIQSITADKWYSKAVFYELFVRSFKDSNGDKYGDFNGVTEKLDYLKELGISCIWFMPINPSAEKADNYDPIEFMDVDPTYGTLDDFKRLLNEAHKRGIRVILDMVINHTSNKHPFFQDAVSNKNSKYRNWYIFSETQPTGSWKNYWHKSDTGWYYGYFVNTKPDLNWKNPEVVDYFFKVFKFWLDMGVDGFRFDAVSLLFENGEGKLKNQPENYEMYSRIRKWLDENYKEREIFTVCESEPPYNSYLGNGKDMFHAVFHFKLNGTIIRAVNNNQPFTDKGISMVGSIPQTIYNELKLKEGGFYATLLSNHDAYAGNRPFQQFGRDIGKTKLAGAIYLTLPGIPFVYYGEEIGMDTYTSSKSDKWLRSCMIWDDSPNFGFTSGKGAWNHLNSGDDELNKKMNVKVQEQDPDSILNLYRKLIKIRTENRALSLGDFASLTTKSKFVDSYIRIFKTGESSQEEIIVVLNFSDKPQNADIDISKISLNKDKKDFVDLLGSKVKITNNKGILKITKIAPYQVIILK